MEMKGYLALLKGSLRITVAFFGISYILTDLIFTTYPLGFIFLGLFAVAIHFAHVPPPPTCKIEDIIGPDPLDKSESMCIIKTIAHRGAGLDAPENSLIAFKMCNEKGVNFIEFDIALTADNVPIVFHDDTLERMAGLQEKIKRKTYKELQEIDISVKHPFRERFTGTRIPTLDETVEQLLQSEQNMFIDVKDPNLEMVNIILSIYEKYPDLHKKAITTSFYPHLIYLIRKKNPKIACSLAWRPYVFAHTSYSYATGKGPRRSDVFYKHYALCFLDWLHESLLINVTYYLLGLSFILLHKDVISGRVVTEWKERGVRVIAWTVNHPLEKQHFARTLKLTYMTDTLTGESSIHQAQSEQSLIT